MRRRVFVGIAGGAAVSVLVAGVVAGQQWSRAQDVEARVDRLEGQLARERSKLENVSTEAGDLRRRVERLQKQRKKAEERWSDQNFCVSRLTNEPAAGEQTITFGYIRGFHPTERALLFDPAEWFVGEDANRVAAAEGHIEPGEPVPNDYYIRNPDQATVVKLLAADAVVVLNRGRGYSFPTARCGTAKELERVFRHPRGWHELIHSSPYWIVDRDGAVVRVLEQYVP